MHLKRGVRRSSQQMNRRTHGHIAVILPCSRSSMANVNGTHQQSFATRFAPIVNDPNERSPVLLAGPALFAWFQHDDRTFKRMSTNDHPCTNARTATAEPPLSDVPFIFTMMGTIHRRDRIRTSVNPHTSLASLFHLYHILHKATFLFSFRFLFVMAYTGSTMCANAGNAIYDYVFHQVQSELLLGKQDPINLLGDYCF